ncbi:DUF4435 domain-containing protein [[Erwinia] mediterraneensis]|uniref:DUF4435 domain-containing protein n=1 Tax=[Erwinia] mediterraneensis TaxID=2161819 RepID=UPI00103268E0|nr:DUF4435 domain-containing protein [[Erwinia] mediterraneensis]
MDDFFYSAEAENIINLFYQSDLMVYVEGPDDICFWEIIFEKASGLKVEIQELGGCKEIEKYIERIIKEDLKVVVACDSDLTKFKDEKHQKTKRIIRTSGYAIENTFISNDGILRAIRTLGKFKAKDMLSLNISKWEEDFYKNIEELVKIDIYNYIHESGIPVIGDSSIRFMKSKNSSLLCENKINTHKEEVIGKIERFNPKEVDELLEKLNTTPKNWLRGHFLFSAIHRLISSTIASYGRKINLSYDALYSILINNFESIFDESHNEFDYYKKEIAQIEF